MVRLSVYILRQIFAWFVLNIACAILLFLGSQLLRIAPIFIGAGPRPLELIYALALLLVPILGWALTPAFAVAVFAVAGRMAADGEIIVTDSAGVGRKILMAAPVLLTVALAIVSAFLWLHAAPASARLLQRKAEVMAGRALLGNLESRRFIHPTQDVTFFANDKKADTFFGVVIEKTDENGHRTQIFASKAKISVASAEMLLRFVLNDGHLFIVPPDDGLPVAVYFEETSIDIPLGPKIKERLDFLPKTMTYKTDELMGSAPQNVSQSRWEYALWRRVGGPVGFLVISLISIGLAFAIPWRHRSRAIMTAGLLFFAYHLLCRFFEGLLDTADVGAQVAALMPSAVIVAVAFLIVIVYRKRQNIAD